jgi:hypothetical protein
MSLLLRYLQHCDGEAVSKIPKCPETQHDRLLPRIDPVEGTSLHSSLLTNSSCIGSP